MSAIQDVLPVFLSLPVLLKVCAGAQIAVAVLNLFLVRILRWRADLDRMSLLPRQVFMVHLWFISMTLFIFGALTWRFVDDFAAGTNAVTVWLAAAIALFWGVRTVLQITYYSRKHWLGQLPKTFAHIGLLFAYGGLTIAYGMSALRGLP